MRAQAEGNGEASARRELEHALLVGGDVVHLHGRLPAGRAGRVPRSPRCASTRCAARTCRCTGGRLLQAAMGLLVVAAEERARSGEDLEALSKRIAEYEAWTGHTAGR